MLVSGNKKYFRVVLRRPNVASLYFSLSTISIFCSFHLTQFALYFRAIQPVMSLYVSRGTSQLIMRKEKLAISNERLSSRAVSPITAMEDRWHDSITTNIQSLRINEKLSTIKFVVHPPDTREQEVLPPTHFPLFQRIKKQKNQTKKEMEKYHRLLGIDTNVVYANKSIYSIHSPYFDDFLYNEGLNDSNSTQLDAEQSLTLPNTVSELEPPPSSSVLPLDYDEKDNELGFDDEKDDKTFHIRGINIQSFI